MKTVKLALLATLTAALALGGLIPATASELPVPADTLSETTAPSPIAENLPDGAETSEAPRPTEHAPTTAEESTAGEPTPTPATAPPEPASSETAEDDDYVYVPVGEGHVVPGPNTPLITETDGSIRSAVETEEHQTVDPALAQGGAASMLSAASRSGNIKVTLVSATVQGRGKPVNLAPARAAISDANRYWKTMSNNRLSMSIVSERVHYSASASANDDYAAMMNKIARELRWVDSPYTALVVFVPTEDLRSGGYGGILGGGWTTGGTAGRILMPAPSNFTSNVVTHEFGHVLGLLHANSLQCTSGRPDVGIGANGRWSDGACSSREYGDTLDLMGSAQNYHPIINSYFWDAGGFGKGNEIRNAGSAASAKTYTLKPWGGGEANRAVKFTDPSSGDTYYLELRQPAGYDAHLAFAGQAGNRGVKIVKADDANSWALNSLVIPPSTKPFSGYYNSNHAWQAGQTFTTHTGTTVRINSVTASSASVTVAASATSTAPASSLYYNANPVTGAKFGTPADQFLTCDWDGDGVSTPATFFRGIWTISNNPNGGSGTRISFGDPGDQPICGDWDGDGKDTIGVYRNGVGYLKNSNTSGVADGVVPFGNKGDVAVVGDWNGDSYDTLGVTRGDGGAKRFYLTNSNLRAVAEGVFLFGNSSDTPVSGDWDNDGYSTVGVKRGNSWFLSNSNIRVLANQTFMFGDPGDKPLTGRWKRNQGTSVGVAR